MIQKQDTFLKFPEKSNVVCIMHEEFSGTFPDYTIFIYKFKTDECFLFMKRFQFTSWRIVRRWR